MSDSGFSRLWNTLKPPPGDNRPGSLKVVEMRKRQRRLVTATLAAFFVLAAAGGIYFYFSSGPQRAEKEFQEGMKLMGPGKYEEAIKHFDRALQIYSQLPDAYLERGNAHRTLGDMEGAVADFQAALDLNSQLAPAQNGLGMIYLERKDINKALEAFTKSIGISPTVDAYYQRGQIFEARGDHQKAIDDYNHAIELQRDSPFIYRSRALAKANIGDAAGAHEDRVIAETMEGRR